MTQTHSDMAQARNVWLIHNKSSGSNDEETLGALRDAFGHAGLTLVGETCFPDEEVPDRATLEAAGADTLASFSGDGTLSSVVRGLQGWNGAVLALPGGTMNMMSRRMHGDATGPEILDRFVDGIVERARPTVIRSRHAIGLTGALTGPGAAWADVREAMRDGELGEFVSTVRDAIGLSASDSKVVCLESDCGREEGYTAITLAPQDNGIEANGYYAESFGDFARQGVALLQRDFRTGPHDLLGCLDSIRIASQDGKPMGLLIDGEAYQGAAEETFELATSEIDFWVTADAR